MSEKNAALSAMFREEAERLFDEYGVGRPQRKSILTDVEEASAEPDGFKGTRLGKIFTGIVTRDSKLLKDMRVKALSEGTTTAGGFLVEDQFWARLIEEVPWAYGIHKLATQFTVNSDTGQMPTRTADVSVAWTSENATIAASDPTFGQLTYTISKLAALNKASRELWEDSAFSMGQLMSRIFSQAVVKELDNKIWNGTGTSEPEGFDSITFTNTTALTATVTIDDLITLIYDVDPQYRAGSWFYIPNGVSGFVRKLKDSNNQYLWQEPVQEGEPARLLGYPIYESDNIPIGTVAAGTGRIWFGNASNYFVFNRSDVRFSTSTEAGDAFADDQVWTKVTLRLDGRMAQEKAFGELTAVSVTT